MDLDGLAWVFASVQCTHVIDDGFQAAGIADAFANGVYGRLQASFDQRAIGDRVVG